MFGPRVPKQFLISCLISASKDSASGPGDLTSALARCLSLSHPSFLSLSSQKTPKRKRAVDYKEEANDETDGTPAKKSKAEKKGKNLLSSPFFLLLSPPLSSG